MGARDIHRAKILFTGYILAYLSIQGHEALHWLIACLLGVKGSIGGFSLTLNTYMSPWKSTAITAGGALATILYGLAGLFLFRTRMLHWRRFGFMLIFINAVGRVLYEFSGLFIKSTTDEVGIAQQLGLPDYLLRVPITLFCILTLAYIMRDKETGLKRPGPLTALSLSLLAGITQVLVLGGVVQTQQALGRWFFQPVFFGYTPFLALFNLAYAALLWRQISADRNRSEFKALMTV